MEKSKMPPRKNTGSKKNNKKDSKKNSTSSYVSAPELVLPAASLEKLELAYSYGADACYGGLKDFSLRRGEADFSLRDLSKACEVARKLKKKFYITFNIFAHNRHLKVIERNAQKAAKAQPDAFIVADPGVINVIKQVAPEIRIHLSTQANTLNYESAGFWLRQGVSRIILARELTLREIRQMTKRLPELEFEVFVHGAMCMAYSGRCLVSSVLTGRSANLGDCTQSCRWEYKVVGGAPSGSGRIQKLEMEEKKRPEGSFILEDFGDYSTWLSSKDLCLLESIPALLESGIKGLKIEGRNKSEFYLGMTARTYSQALVMVKEKKLSRTKVANELKKLKKDLDRFAHRPYFNGFLYGRPADGEAFKKKDVNRSFLGVVKGHSRGYAKVSVRNPLKTGDLIEIIEKDTSFITRLSLIKDSEGNTVGEIKPGPIDQTAFLKLPVVSKYALIAKPVNS